MKSFRTFLENVGEFASNLRAYHNSPKEILKKRREEAAERLDAIRQKGEEQQRKAAERANAIRQQQRREKD